MIVANMIHINTQTGIGIPGSSLVVVVAGGRAGEVSEARHIDPLIAASRRTELLWVSVGRVMC